MRYIKLDKLRGKQKLGMTELNSLGKPAEVRFYLREIGNGGVRYSHLIYLLTTRVVGAPQMISQPVSSIFSLFSTALWDLANSRPVHFLMLSSHLLLCLPCLLPPFTVPCEMV